MTTADTVSIVEHHDTIETGLFGYELLNDPLLKKGRTFTDDERDAFDLHGLLSPHVATLDEQVARRMQAFRHLRSDLSIDRIGARSGRRVLW